MTTTETKLFKSTRDSKIVKLIKSSSGRCIIEDETGKQTEVMEGTLKRWYKKYDPSEEVIETPKQLKKAVETKVAKAQEEAAPKVLVTEAPAQLADVQPAKEKKAKKEVISGNHPLVAFLKQLAKDGGYPIFESTEANFMAIRTKDAKHYIMPFIYNTKNVVVWVKSEALEGLNINSKYASHTYDARISFPEDTPEARKQIEKIFKGALKNYESRVKAREDAKVARKSAKANAKKAAAENQSKAKKNLQLV